MRRNGFRYKVMPIGEDRTAHPLWIDERRSLKHAVDESWAASVKREVTLSVKERRSEQLHMTGRRMIDRPTVVQTQKTLHQEVLELKLVDKPIPTAPERPPGWEDAAVLRPEDVLGRLPTEPDASDTAREEPPGKPPRREPATPREQTVPVPGLSAVLQSQTEGVITVGEGEESRQVRYEGPRFEIRGGAYFRVDQPVDPEPTLPEETNPRAEADPAEELNYVSPSPIRFAYPSDVLVHQIGGK